MTAPTWVTHLTGTLPASRPTPSAEQVRALVKAIEEGVGPQYLILKEFSGWDVGQVRGVATELGTYLLLSRIFAGGDVPVSQWGEDGTLFPIGEDDTSQVLLPPEWVSVQGSRDNSQVIARIAASDIGDKEIENFISRRYKDREIDLEAEHLYLLSWLSENRLLGRLEELTEKEGRLAQALLEAWKVMETFAGRAHTAISFLCSGPDAQTESGAILAACDRCEWVNPGEIGRVRAAVEALEGQPDSESLRRIAKGRLDSFKSLMAPKGKVIELSVPRDIGAGRVRGLCELAGLRTGENAEE